MVDEIDLHLHAVHQNTVLPELIKMFPRVQFIMTTHSPLFVLGMQRTLGRMGLHFIVCHRDSKSALRNSGNSVAPTNLFLKHKSFWMMYNKLLRTLQKPIIFVDGKTDIKYLQKAAELLGKQSLLEKIQLWDGEGYGNLNKVWDKFDSKISEIVPQTVILVNDCDKPGDDLKGKVFKRSIPKQEDHPLDKGIENLFSKATLEKAIKEKPQFVDIVHEHSQIIRGKEVIVAENGLSLIKTKKPIFATGFVRMER